MKILRSTFMLCCVLLPLFTVAQNEAEVLKKYRENLEAIQSVSYDVRQLDTFVTGTVWDYPGRVTQIKDTSLEFLGFRFMASKEVINRGALYDGLQMFEIEFEPKTYEVETQVGPHVMGAPAAQMVVPEMMYYQDSIPPEIIENEDHYILVYHFPDVPEHSISEKKKSIHLDKATWLPVKVISSLVSLGKKQVQTRLISNTRINHPEDVERLDKAFLEDFEPEIQENREPAYRSLLSQPLKDITLADFDEMPYLLKDQKGKVLLLDFWEVWCGPCRKSMPKVQELHEQYRSEGLEVAAILLDESSKDSAQMLLEKKGITFTQLVGNEATRSDFKVYAIPQYVLVDREGIVRHIYTGYDEIIETHVQELLKP